ncbi:uncharacterized protein TrAtP1_007946 [Trichoderma atroviride]|uniref:uncharacterized protein n=1 Tax=Hypocrea atroviridis TaxID=63577 RepID=UPI003325F5C0|nr:hypothetical protein TrAtP1_007946 [Trichoderma atroviride]
MLLRATCHCALALLCHCPTSLRHLASNDRVEPPHLPRPRCTLHASWPVRTTSIDRHVTSWHMYDVFSATAVQGHGLLLGISSVIGIRTFVICAIVRHQGRSQPS